MMAMLMVVTDTEAGWRQLSAVLAFMQLAYGLSAL